LKFRFHLKFANPNYVEEKKNLVLEWDAKGLLTFWFQNLLKTIGLCSNKFKWMDMIYKSHFTTYILTPKGPLSVWGTNEISGRYLEAEFLLWFFEFFLEDRKTDHLQGNIIFFSINVWEQKLYSNMLKTSSKKTFVKNWMFFECFFHRLYFCLFGKLWFIPFGFVIRKLWTILFWGHLEHLPKEKTL